MKRTKIICTIGPSSHEVNTLVDMINNGMDVARLNFSHGTYDDHKNLISNIHLAEQKSKKTVAIIQDLQGPRIRVGKLQEKGVLLNKNKTIIFTTDLKYKDNYKDKKIFITYENLHKEIKKNEIILISDGLIKLKVTKVIKKDIFAKVIIGGNVKSNKGLNFPNTNLKISPITRKDHDDLFFGISQDVDFIALSFVGSANDVLNLRQLIKRASDRLNKTEFSKPKIISKIEKLKAIENIDSIIQVSDAIMVARGDLGIELPAHSVPIIQKEVIKKCMKAGKPVIVATQMLESMITNPRPTRAEVSDVANAVIDHTDAVMLSGETANGQYPKEAVLTMAQTITEIENSPYDDLSFIGEKELVLNEFKDSIGVVVSALAKSKKIDCVVLICDNENFIGAISSHRPELPVFVITNDENYARQLKIVWGVEGIILNEEVIDIDFNNVCVNSKKIFTKIISILKKKELQNPLKQILGVINFDDEIILCYNQNE